MAGGRPGWRRSGRLHAGVALVPQGEDFIVVTGRMTAAAGDFMLDPRFGDLAATSLLLRSLD
jgi:hypothetical protein